MTILEHFENGLMEFNSEDEFIEFVKDIALENEDDNSIIVTYEDAINYVQTYCANFSLIQS